MKVIITDGGRKTAGFQGGTGDCVVRAVAIASGLSYEQVYKSLALGMGTQRGSSGKTCRKGISTTRKWFKDYMASIGAKWTPTMGIGTGCKVHLKDGELPNGRLAVAVSRHYVAVVDGVIHDLWDCSRGGTRCVYGYWTF